MTENKGRKISIAICDDDEQILRFVKEKLERHYGEQIQIHLYSDPEQLVAEWERIGEMKENVVIMDIQYASSNGIRIVKELQKTYGQNVKVIFITGYADYSTEIFQAEPTYFLIKPIEEEKLYEAVDRAMRKVDEERGRTISFLIKGRLMNLDVDRIIYIESDKRNLNIHESNNTTIVMMKLDDLEKQLPSAFLRCHQSYLVNMNFIKSFIGLEIELSDGTIIPVSRAKAKDTREEFFQYLGQLL